MYKSVTYQTRDILDLKKEITWAAKRYPSTHRVFLADGDVMLLAFDRLDELLTCLNAAFPRLARVSLYANGSSILSKTQDQLARLRKLKLSTLYIGLESGNENLLRLVKKGETATGMVEAVNLAQAVGLRCSVMILIGLGGRNISRAHAEFTAEAVNAMAPKLLSALRYVHFREYPMFEGFEPVTEHEAVAELRHIIAGLELDGTVFRANHTSNPIPLEGRFPRDKSRLLDELDELLAHGGLDRSGPGHMPFAL